MGLTTEKLNEKTSEIANQFNGLTVAEGQYITRFIDQKLCSRAIINFNPEKEL